MNIVKKLIRKALNNKMIRKTLRWLVDIFSEGYNILFLFLLLLFFLRPLNRDFIYIATWELCLACVFIIAIFVCRQPKFIRRAAMCVGIPALLVGWAGLIFPITALILSGVILTILFMIICILAVFHREILMVKGKWTSYIPVMCAYFLIGYAFAYGYVLMEFLFPGIMKLVSPSPVFFAHGEVLSQAVAFSFSSLLCLNTPDPTNPTTFQTMIVAEGLASQFYLAALASQMVGVYRDYRKSHKNKKIEKASKDEES